MVRNLKRAYTGKERRSSERRSVLETFSLFAVLPEKGVHRLPIHNVSEGGISIDLDTDGEDPAAFPVREGDIFKLHLYLNQSLYLPLSIKVVRLDGGRGPRSIGAEFLGEPEAAAQGLAALGDFLKALDRVRSVAGVTL